MTDDDWGTAASLLRASAQLVDGVQRGLAFRGFDDVRPAHGFAFALLSGEPLTTAELAVGLAITKQAAAQLVEHLVARDYVTRRPDPRDGRAQLLVLTRRGRACTAAAESAAAEVIATWRERVSSRSFGGFARTLAEIDEPGRLRPSW